MKKIVRRYWWLVLSLLLSILFFSWGSFVQPFTDLADRFSAGSWFSRFSTGNTAVYDRISADFLKLWETISSIFTGLTFKGVVEFLLKLVYAIFLYGVSIGGNFVLLLYCIFDLYFSKETESTKTGRGALFVIWLNKILVLALNAVKKGILWLWEQRKSLLYGALIFFFSRGWLFSIVSEIAFFVYYYIVFTFDLKIHILLTDLLKTVVILVFGYLPKWVAVLLALLILVSVAFSRANRVLAKNMESLKCFVKYDTKFITFFNGKPSVGKTRLMTACGLACEENYIDEIEETLFQMEMSAPDVNWGDMEKDRFSHLKYYPEHFFFSSYLQDRYSLIASVPFAVLDPYVSRASGKDRYTKILDLDWLRPNVQCSTNPIDKYKIVLWSEIDKEYNSHYTKKEVGEDGVYLTFGTGSHWGERKWRIFADYQVIAQVPLNVRGNGETFIYINDSEYHFPFLLSLVKLPFEVLYSLLRRLIVKYESYKLRLARDSRRFGIRKRKRFDYTGPYAVLRFLMYYVSNVLNWFSKYGYTRFIFDFTDCDGKVLDSGKVNVNAQDEEWKGSRLYDSTFLSRAYAEKREKSDQRWEELREYSSIYPSVEELRLCHSEFLNKSLLNDPLDESPSAVDVDF